MNLEKAKSVPGWMSDEEMAFLAEQAAHHRSIVEIGSWRGRSTTVLAEHTPGIVYAVDTWVDDAYGIPGWWTDKDVADHGKKDWLWKEFSTYLKDYLHRNVYPVRLFSLEAAVLLSRYVRFDMIFIDADHSADSVRADLQAWRPLLREGGLICGHDYNHPTCPGVKPVVDELIPSVKVVDTIWYSA